MMDTKKNSVFLHPDEMVFSMRETNITTVLGSCIAVTVYCPEKKVGGMCHASLPICPDLQLNLNLNKKLLDKYVDSSIHKLMKWMDGKCLTSKKMEVKVFGGTNYLLRNNENSLFNVGKQNINSALETLKEFKIKPKAVDVGGVNGRKIIFNTFDGSVLLKRI